MDEKGKRPKRTRSAEPAGTSNRARWRDRLSCTTIICTPTRSTRRRSLSRNTVLYSNKMSSCSWRVRIVLNIKRVLYEIEPMALGSNNGVNQFTNEVLEINPMKHVPALHIDNHTLIGSLNMLLYLEETRPQPPLLPDDPVNRSRVREICEIIASGIQPLQYILVLEYVGEERKLQWAKYWITRGFLALERLLVLTAGKYCVGDTVTLADCCLVPQMHNARLYDVDLTPYPTMLTVERRLRILSPFITAHPCNHPFCPEDHVYP